MTGISSGISSAIASAVGSSAGGGAGGVLLDDDFTEASKTAITSHTPDVNTEGNSYAAFDTFGAGYAGLNGGSYGGSDTNGTLQSMAMDVGASNWSIATTNWTVGVSGGTKASYIGRSYNNTWNDCTYFYHTGNSIFRLIDREGGAAATRVDTTNTDGSSNNPGTLYMSFNGDVFDARKTGKAVINVAFPYTRGSTIQADSGTHVFYMTNGTGTNGQCDRWIVDTETDIDSL